MVASLNTSRPALDQDARSGQARVRTITADTTLSQELHDGQTLVLNSATGAVLTLPASAGTGMKFRVIVRTSVTSNSYKIQVANATDVMTGTAILFQDSGDTTVSFNTASSSDTLTMDGSTQGGLAGAHCMVEDIASGIWHVAYVSDASGTEATPFSAAVS